MLRRCIQFTGYGLALLMPLIVDPWAALPFEPVKVAFLRWTMMGLLLVIGCVACFPGHAGVRSILHWPQPQRWLMLVVLAYGISVIVSALTSIDPRQSWWGASDQHGVLTTWCGLLLFVLLFGTIQTPRQAALHFLALVAGSIPVCIYGLAQVSGNDPLTWETDSVSPLLSTLGRSNTVGAYLAVVIPITLYLAWVAWQCRRWSALACVGMILLLQVVCLRGTEARAGWLAFLAGVSLWWWFLPTEQTLRYKLFGLLGFLLICVLIFVGFEQIGARLPTPQGPINTTAFVERRADSVERRFIIWSHTLLLLRERWLLGYGPEAFVNLFNRRYPPGTLYTGADTLVDDPHNVLLAQAMDGGLLGVLAWLAVIVAFYCYLFSLPKEKPMAERRALAAALCGGMTAYIVQAQFNPDTIVLTLYFWLLVAYSGGAIVVWSPQGKIIR